MEPKADGTDASADAPADADSRLLPAAAAAARHAYAPYSRFQVGAAVLAESGAVYTGANVENASYPVGTCAEAGALAAARTAEGEGLKATAVLIYAESGGVRQPCAPCGACRQRLTEFNPDMAVTFLSGGRGWVTVRARELLPYAFQF
jgi:cytidine deaminase